MPYAHYLTFFASHKDPRAFAQFVQDVEAIIENAPEGSDLCGRSPKEAPIVLPDRIIVGSSQNASPFSRLKVLLHGNAPKHRYPMIVIRTDRLVYDAVICACLLAFRHSFPASEITSDGTSDDWASGIALYEFSTERKAPVTHIRK